jgi:hypothetical protein
VLLPLVRPLWRQLMMFAPGQILDDNELESLGVGIERYAVIEIPVLLLGGTRSPSIFASAWRRLQRSCPMFGRSCS